jgi:hypothetical protein
MGIDLLRRDEVRIVAGERVRRATNLKATNVFNFCRDVVWAERGGLHRNHPNFTGIAASAVEKKRRQGTRQLNKT